MTRTTTATLQATIVELTEKIAKLEARIQALEKGKSSKSRTRKSKSKSKGATTEQPVVKLTKQELIVAALKAGLVFKLKNGHYIARTDKHDQVQITKTDSPAGKYGFLWTGVTQDGKTVASADTQSELFSSLNLTLTKLS